MDEWKELVDLAVDMAASGELMDTGEFTCICGEREERRGREWEEERRGGRRKRREREREREKKKYSQGGGLEEKEKRSEREYLLNKLFIPKHTHTGSSVDPTLLEKLEELLPGYRKPITFYTSRYVCTLT